MKLLHKILKGASLTSALFVFQACYGSPYPYDGVDVTFKLVSDVDGSPIKDVKLLYKEAGEWSDCGRTAADGTIGLYAIDPESCMNLKFSTEDGKYEAKDTVICTVTENVIEIRLKPVK